MPSPPHAPKSRTEALIPQLQGRRLLVVDDNEISRSVLVLHTRRWGMETTGCASGEEALRVLEKGEQFEAAVIDMVMPDMDGLALATTLRKIPHAVKMPVILLSSVGMDKLDPNLLQAGFFSTLPKPWKASTLLRELIRVAGREDQPVATSTQKLLNSSIASELPVKILIVEDNLTNRRVVLTVLRALGYEPDMAENGRTGIAKAESGDYDLILLDLQMPDLDGFAVARHVRQHVTAKRPFIVAVTAGVTPEDRQRCFDAGMDDFVMKPFKISTLKEVVLKYARQARETLESIS